MALKAVAAPLGSPVGGSGTVGTIPVWGTTTTTLTDSPLTVSGTTVTATQAFTVNGTQTFNGNLVSGFNQTWTLNGGFLNIQSGLLYLDKTNSRIGIGTTSPTGRLHVVGGTATSGNGTPLTLIAQSGQASGNTNGGNIVLTPGSKFGTGTDGLVDLSSPLGTGLKLPATPGNGDAQTLDAYQENTAWTPVVTNAGGTTPTVFASTCTRIGRLVICNIVLTATAGNTYSSTYGTTTINLPVAAAALCAATLAQGTNAVPNATVSGGNILLPTFALTTVATVVTALYYV